MFFCIPTTWPSSLLFMHGKCFQKELTLKVSAFVLRFPKRVKAWTLGVGALGSEWGSVEVHWRVIGAEK